MIKRKLGFDNLGRITIPKDIRDMLGIGGKNNVMIMYDNDKLIIPKVDDTKVITESIDSLQHYAGYSNVITNKEYETFKEILIKLRSEAEERD